MAVDRVQPPVQHAAAAAHPVRDVRQTTCCIAGGGPAGAVLALLLARQGIPVMLLEAHADFDRDFRGDTIHPSAMELMDELGLSDRLLQLRHTKIRTMSLPSEAGPIQVADFGRLKTRHPYIVMLPQVHFLEFIVAEAQRYPHFQLVMGANVQQLVEEDGAVRGVRYQGRDGWHEVRALLTVGADGRFSRVRRLAGMEPIKTSPPMDVLWFRLPRKPDDPAGAFGGFGSGHGVVLLDRSEEWQIAYLIPKDSYQEIHAAGITELRRSLAAIVPMLADRVDHLVDWKQVALLSVESSRVRRWYRPGLLLIGDAAHVMSPVGGVGINYAIQDAVAAANVLCRPLKAGRLELRDLAAVQRRREWPTRIIQTFQTLIQRRLIGDVLLKSSGPVTPPSSLRLLLGLPVLRDLVPRLIAFGVWPVHVKLAGS